MLEAFYAQIIENPSFLYRRATKLRRKSAISEVSRSDTKHTPFLSSWKTTSATARARIDSILSNRDDTIIPEEHLVGHGRFQIMVLFCAHLSAALLTFHHLSILILAPSVDHWCRPPKLFAHLDVDLWKNLSIPLDEEGRFSQCTVYDPPNPPLYPSRTSRRIVPCKDWDYELPLGVETIQSKWNLVCERRWYTTLATVYYSLGNFLFVPLLAQLSDKMGRRNVIYGCVFSAVLSSQFALFSGSFAIFLLGRMFLGASVSTIRVNTFILLFEITAPEYRDYYCSIARLGLVIGSLVVTVLGNFLLDRRVIGMLGMMPTLLLVFSFYAVEESPRWLLAMWDYHGLKRVLLWISRVNKLNLTMMDTQEEFKKKREEELHVRNRLSIIDLFRNVALRARTIALCGMWFCLLFSLFGMWHTSPKTTSYWVVVLFTVPRAASVPISYALLKLYGRKAALGVALPLSCGLALVLSLSRFQTYVETLVHELTLSSILLEVLLVDTYSLELYPTVMRAMGVCVPIFCGRLGAAFSFFLEELSRQTHPSIPLLLITFCMICARVLLKWLPETKDQKIPNSLCDIEADMVKHTVTEIVQGSGNTFDFRRW